MKGIKHLIECHCTLKIFERRRNQVYHKFTVYSKIDDTGRIKLTTDGRHAIDIVSRMIKEDDNTITGRQAAEAIPLSNKIGHGGTKPDNRWKIEASKNFTIAPAYNKGPYMVVAKEDIKTAGRKV